MGNEKNLISLGDRTTEERREIARKGGIVSGKARKEKRLAKDLAKIIYYQPTDNEDAIKEIQSKYPDLKAEDIHQVTEILFTLSKLARKKEDLKAMEMMLAILGEKPADHQEIDFTDNGRIDVYLGNKPLEDKNWND